MIYSIGKRIKNFVKVRIYQFHEKRDDYRHYNGYSSEDQSEIELKKYYYSDGRLKAETFYKNGKLEGIANYYYETGDLKAREFYKNNQLHGLSKWYYESGELKSERYYQDGSLVSRKEYDKSGILVRTGSTD